MREVEIHSTYKCKYNCVFCSVKEHPKNEPTKEELIENIELTEDFDKLKITGGEPLLRKDLNELIKIGEKYHQNIELETHGMNFSRERFKKFIDSGLTSVKISCHTNCKKIYSKISRNEDSFDNTLNLLNKIEEFSDLLEIKTNTVITKYNYSHLVKIAEWLNKNFDFLDEIRMSYPRFYPIEDHENYSKKYLLPLPLIKEELTNLVDRQFNNLVLENIPLCIVDTEFAKNVNWDKYLAKNGEIKRGLEGRKFLEKCKKCDVKNECQGLHKHYNLYYKPNFIEPIDN